MKVFVRAFGPLQAALGKDRLELELPDGARVKDAILVLVDSFILLKRPDLWDITNKQFRVPVVIMVSSKDVQDDNQPLADQQEIFLVAPMAGG